MNKQSFDPALGHSKPRKISEPQSCVAASGDKMSSCEVFKVDLWMNGVKANSIAALKKWYCQP